MQASKILLSAEELSLVKNRDFILTKNRVIKKIVEQFADLTSRFQTIAQPLYHTLPEAVSIVSPKIYKGEQHLGFPYVMLDFPRVFSREDVLAIRTFFWWGHFFSITLQLKGKYRQKSIGRIEANLTSLKERKFHLAISDDEWRNDFEEDNYSSLDNLTIEGTREKLSGMEFLKLSKKWSLEDADLAMTEIDKDFEMLIGMLAD